MPFQYLVRTTSTFSTLRLSSTRCIWTEARVSPSSSPPGAHFVNTRSKVPLYERKDNRLACVDVISNLASPSVHTRMGSPRNLRNTPQSVQYPPHHPLHLFYLSPRLQLLSRYDPHRPCNETTPSIVDRFTLLDDGVCSWYFQLFPTCAREPALGVPLFIPRNDHLFVLLDLFLQPQPALRP